MDKKGRWENKHKLIHQLLVRRVRFVFLFRFFSAFVCHTHTPSLFSIDHGGSGCSREVDLHRSSLRLAKEVLHVGVRGGHVRSPVRGCDLGEVLLGAAAVVGRWGGKVAIQGIDQDGREVKEVGGRSRGPGRDGKVATDGIQEGHGYLVRRGCRGQRPASGCQNPRS